MAEFTPIEQLEGIVPVDDLQPNQQATGFTPIDQLQSQGIVADDPSMPYAPWASDVEDGWMKKAAKATGQFGAVAADAVFSGAQMTVGGAIGAGAGLADYVGQAARIGMNKLGWTDLPGDMKLSTEKAVETAVKEIEHYTEHSLSEVALKLGVPEDWVRGAVYDGAMKILGLPSEGADYIAGSAVDMGAYPIVGAGIKTGGELLAFALAGGIIRGGVRKARGVASKSNVKMDESVYDQQAERVSQMVDSVTGRKERTGQAKGPEITPYVPDRPFYESKPLEPEPAVTRPGGDYAKRYEDGIDFEKSAEQIERPRQTDAYDPTPPWEETAFQKAEFDMAKDQAPRDTAADLLGAEAPLEFGKREGTPLKEVDVEYPNKKKRKRKRMSDVINARIAEGKQLDLNWGRDPFFEKGQELVGKEGFLKSADELLASKYFEGEVARMAEGKPKRIRGFGNQGGFISPDILGAGKVADLIAAGKKKMADVLDKFKGTFNAKELDLAVNDAYRPGTRRTLVWMSPDEFLNLAERRPSEKADPVYGRYYERKRRSIRKGLDTEAGLHEIPMLGIHEMMGKHRVTRHEGRHRADVMKEKGIDKMPVVLEHATHRWIEDSKREPKMLRNQDGKADFPMPQRIFRPEKESIYNPRSRGQGGAVDPKVFAEGIDKAVKGIVKGFKWAMEKGRVGATSAAKKAGDTLPSGMSFHERRGPAIERRDAFEGFDALPNGAKTIIPDYDLGRVLSGITPDTKGKTKAGTIDETPIGRLPDGSKVQDPGGFGRTMMNDFQMASMYKNNPVIKWFMDHVTHADRMFDRMRESFKIGEVMGEAPGAIKRGINKVIMPSAVRGMYRHEAGPLSYIDRMPQKERLQFWRAVDHFDANPILMEQGLQWPTREMLQKQGLNETQVKAYERMARLMDDLYDLDNWSIRQTKPNYEGHRQIPGYFPHMNSGAWALKVQVPGKKPGTKKLVFFGRTHTKLGARDLKAKLEKQAQTDPRLKELLNEGVEYIEQRVGEPHEVGATIATFDKTLEVMDNNHWATPLIRKVFTGIKGSMEEGVLTSALKRHGVRGWSTDTIRGSLDPALMRKVLERRIDMSIDFAKSQYILANIERPLEIYRTQFDKRGMNGTFEWIKNRSMSYRGQPTNKLEFAGIDKALNGFIDKVTGGNFSGYTANSMLRFVRNFFTSKSIGFWSPAYLLGNIVQPHYMGMPILVREASRLGAGNPWSALMMDLNTLDVPGHRLDPEIKAVLDWGSKNKVITPRLMENIDFIKTKEDAGITGQIWNTIKGRRIADHIEEVGRAKSLVASYKFYRSAGQSRQVALKNAASLVDEIMMNYDRAHRPALYTDYGIVGEAMSPFMVFAHGQLANFVIAARAIKENKGLKNKAMPLVTQSLVGLFWGGLQGVIGIAEIDAIIKGYNYIARIVGDEDSEIGLFSDWVLESTGLAGHDMAMFGALSEATKPASVLLTGQEHSANLGSMMRAPTINDLLGAAALEWLYDVGANSMTVLKWINGSATENDIFKLLNQVVVPNSLVGYSEAFQQRNVPGDMLGRKVAPNTYNRGEGTYNRTQEDWNVRMLTGRRSLEEERWRAANRRVKEKRLSRQEKRTSLPDLAADYILRKEPIPHELYKQAWKAGIPFHEFSKRARNAANQRRQSEWARRYGKTETRNREIEREDRMRYLPRGSYRE